VPFVDSSAATSQQDYSTCPVASGLLQRRAGWFSSFYTGTVSACLISVFKFIVTSNLHTCIYCVIVLLCRYEGVKGFYKGLIPGVLRVTPACCITFVVYENMITLLVDAT